MGPFIFVSILFLAGSLGTLWWARVLQGRNLAIASASVIPLGQLVEDSAAVSREMGSGSFRQEVRIRGKIRCGAPLVSELSRTSCAAYKFTVTREREEVFLERDSQGEETQRVQRIGEVVASNEATVVFDLDDGSAQVPVNPEGAKIQWVKTHSSYRPASPVLADFTLGAFTLAQVPVSNDILGYRYEEFCLPLDREVTVVAEASDLGGSLTLRSPETQGAPFLVTTKSFQELTRGNKVLISTMKGIALGLGAVACLIFLLGVVR